MQGVPPPPPGAQVSIPVHIVGNLPDAAKSEGLPSSGGGAPIHRLTMQLLPMSQFPSETLAVPMGGYRQQGAPGGYPDAAAAQDFTAEVRSDEDQLHAAAAASAAAAHQTVAAVAMAEAQADSRVRELEADVTELVEQNK